MHMYFILTKTVETLHQSTSAGFVSLLNMSVFYQVLLLKTEEGLEGNRTVG